MKLSSRKPGRSRTPGRRPVGLLILSCFAAWAVACSRTGEGGRENLFRIPWPDGSGKYALENISVKTYDHPETLQGRYAALLVDPYIRDGILESSAPVGRYIRSESGAAIASDFISLQAATIHAHYERIADVDAAAGAPMKWPAHIGLQANLNDGVTPLRNNAIYDGQLDALLIVPYDQSQVPIAMNGGVLAHEHFHMLFQGLVIGRLANATTAGLGGLCDWRPHLAAEVPTPAGRALEKISGDEQVRLYNSFVLRAINEGLADFWAWLYTGDPSFIAASLPAENERRRLDGPVTGPLPGRMYMASWMRAVNGRPLRESQLIANAYFVGTSYARALYGLGQILDSSAAGPGVAAMGPPSGESRRLIARSLMRALPAFADKVIEAVSSSTMISPNEIITALLRELPAGDGRACHFLKGVTSAEWDPETASVHCEGDPTVLPPMPPSPTPVVSGAGANPLASPTPTPTPTSSPSPVPSASPLPAAGVTSSPSPVPSASPLPAPGEPLTAATPAAVSGPLAGAASGDSK